MGKYDAFFFFYYFKMQKKKLLFLFITISYDKKKNTTCYIWDEVMPIAQHFVVKVLRCFSYILLDCEIDKCIKLNSCFISHLNFSYIMYPATVTYLITW